MVIVCKRLSKELKARCIRYLAKDPHMLINQLNLGDNPVEVILNFPENDPYVVIDSCVYRNGQLSLMQGYISSQEIITDIESLPAGIKNLQASRSGFTIRENEFGLEFIIGIQ